MIPNSTKVQSRSRPTATSRRPKAPDTNLSDVKRRISTDRLRTGRSMSDRSFEPERRSIPLISQRHRSASSGLGAPPTASLETTACPMKPSRPVGALSSPDIFDRWSTWSHRESSHSSTTASTTASSSSSSSSPSSSPASKKQAFADQFQVRRCLAARGKEIRTSRSRRGRPMTNEANQHSERRPTSEETTLTVKANSKVTFSSSAKKIDGGSRVRRCRSSNSGPSSTAKADRRRHARHRKCEIEGLSLMQSLSISDQDHSTGIDETNVEASDSMRTLVSMSSYETPTYPSSLDPSSPVVKTCAQMAARSECGPTSTGSSGSLEVIWSPPCA